jgi:hypothetical protein
MHPFVTGPGWRNVVREDVRAEACAIWLQRGMMVGSPGVLPMFPMESLGVWQEIDLWFRLRRMVGCALMMMRGLGRALVAEGDRVARVGGWDQG